MRCEPQTKLLAGEIIRRVLAESTLMADVQMPWRDRPAEPWGDADRAVVSGNGPMFVNVLESKAAYHVIGEFDPADCEHVEVHCPLDHAHAGFADAAPSC